MSKILCLDYGTKKTGVAITDETRTFAFGLDTVLTKDLFSFLTKIFKQEKIDLLIVGEPKQMNGEVSESEKYILQFLTKFEKTFPKISFKRVDERFTSKLAFDSMIAGGLKKKQRQNKELVDKISATIILQTYLNSF